MAAHLIPDNDDRDNDKVYFFFTEKAMEAGDPQGAIHTRIGRVCAVSLSPSPSTAPLTRRHAQLCSPHSQTHAG